MCKPAVPIQLVETVGAYRALSFWIGDDRTTGKWLPLAGYRSLWRFRSRGLRGNLPRQVHYTCHRSRRRDEGTVFSYGAPSRFPNTTAHPNPSMIETSVPHLTNQPARPARPGSLSRIERLAALQAKRLAAWRD